MRFEKTTGDLNIVNKIHPRDVGLYEVLDIILDLMLDVRQETGRELSELPVTGEAAAKWMAVANALRSIPIDAEALSLTRRRREKLPQLKKELAEKEAGVQQTERETEAVREEERRLQEKLEEYRARCEELDLLRGSVSQIQAEIKELETELALSDSIDIDSVKERREQLLKAKSDSQKRVAVYNEYTAQLSTALAELEQVKSDVAAVCEQLGEVGKSREQEEQALAQKRGELQLAAAEKNEALRKLIEENESLAAQIDAQIQRTEELVAEQKSRCAEKESELEKLRGDLTAQEAAAEELDGQIDILLGEVKTQKNACESKRLQTEALACELAQAKETADRTEREFQSLTDRNKDVAWQISALKSRKADFDKEHETLSKSRMELEYAIKLKQDDIAALNKELSQKRLEQKQREDELRAAREALATAEEQLAAAETAASRARVTLETLKNNIKDVKQRLSAASAEEAELTEDLNACRKELTQKLASKSSGIKKLNEELAALTDQYESSEREYLSLFERQSTLSANLERMRSESEVIRSSMETMRAEEEDAQLRQEAYEVEKTRLEQKLSDYQNAIEVYEAFFDSAECREMTEEIERMERIVSLYQDGVQSLFGTAAPPVEHLGSLQYQFDQMRRRLRDQVSDVQSRLQGLSKDYLSLISQIEREVKL